MPERRRFPMARARSRRSCRRRRAAASIAVVDDPAGRGQAVVISYLLFSEGAKNGEAGRLLYCFRL
jgi:hypothetical protein